jgi:hypothetical protein
MTTNIPLELKSDKFGELDSGQLDLICNKNALDLVLIEDANEIVRRIFQDEDRNSNYNSWFIEDLLTDLQSETKDKITKAHKVVILDIQKFQYADSSPNKPKFTKAQMTSFNKLLTKHKNCLVIIEIDLQEFGGHFICAHKRLKSPSKHSPSNKSPSKYEIKIFDSMSPFGKYSVEFITEFNNISTIKAELTGCLTFDYMFQETGGFDSNIPIKFNKPKYKVYADQFTESQNHFCYIWCIWFIHSILLDYNINDIIAKVNSYDSIHIIKQYAWSILMYKRCISEIDEMYKSKYITDFFIDNFQYVWDINSKYKPKSPIKNSPNKNNKIEFYRVKNTNIDTHVQLDNFKDCFLFSLIQPNLVIVDNSKIPDEVKCVKRSPRTTRRR